MPNDAPILTAEPQQSTALAVIPPASLPLIVAADKDGILESLARKVAAFEPDISTKKGRDAMRSLAYEIAQAKSKLDSIGKGLTEDQRKLIDKVNAERKLVRDRLEELQEKVRAPLTEYEEAEKARVAAHEAAIATIESWAEVPPEWTSEQIATRIAELGNDPLITRDWQEFKQRAEKASKAAYNALVATRIAAEDRERAAAEEARRQAEEAERRRQEEERQRQEREAEIARQAAERARIEAEQKAERDRQEAERRAQAEREAAARREQEAREAAERAERQRQEAEAHAKREREAAETARIERHRATIESLGAADRFQTGNPTAAAIQARIEQVAAASLELDEFAQEGFQTREATLTRLRAMLVEAEQREQRRAELLEQQRREQADREAQQRLEQQQAAERAEAEKRAANTAHLARVNRDAQAAIVTAISDVHSGNAAEAAAIAKAVVIAIARGEVPAVSIAY